jgi:hypothetical protein
MKRSLWVCGLLITAVAGCNSDIVCTMHLKEIDHKCVYITPVESADPQVGKVIRDVIEKEFVRKGVDLCDANSATVILTGSTFMTTRALSSSGLFSSSSESAQAVESISLIAKDRKGQILLSASYDNKDGSTVSKLAKEFGSAVADKLR